MCKAPDQNAHRQLAQGRLETISRRISSSFFPPASWKTAPTFNVFVSRVADAGRFGALQNAVVAKFPNVSAIDLTSVIQTVDSILRQGRDRDSRHVALRGRRRE